MNKACATRATRPRARPNACEVCAGHGSERQGRGRSNLWPPPPETDRFPRFLRARVLKGGVLPGRAGSRMLSIGELPGQRKQRRHWAVRTGYFLEANQLAHKLRHEPGKNCTLKVPLVKSGCWPK
jgi:hypothetical protein